MRLSKFENERVISFIPPDGDFDLIAYRLETSIKSMFGVSVVTKESGNKIEFYMKARANFKSNCTANDVTLLIP